MLTLNYLKTKSTYFSVIGSVLYGLMCASFPTPEVVAIIGCVNYFLCAASFFFAMYILCSEYKEKITLKSVTKWLLYFFITLNIISVTYMLLTNVTAEVASKTVGKYLSAILYYMPFLP